MKKCSCEQFNCFCMKKNKHLLGLNTWRLDCYETAECQCGSVTLPTAHTEPGTAAVHARLNGWMGEVTVERYKKRKSDKRRKTYGRKEEERNRNGDGGVEKN